MEHLGEGLVTLIILVAVGYYLKLDMADMTGMCRERAAKNTHRIAEELGFAITSKRSSKRQDVMEKRYGQFQIMVDGDHARIEVDFNRPLGFKVSSLSNDDMDAGKLQAFKFSNRTLNRFFVLKVASQKTLENLPNIEQALLPLVEQFQGRSLKYLYIEEEYLRIGFSYRSYLPEKVIKQSLPVVEKTAQALSALRKSRKST